MSKTSDAVASNSKHVSDDVRAFGRDVLKLAGSIGEDAKSRADDLGDDAREQMQGAYSSVKAQVSSNPAMALGLAVGAGVLLGLLLKGRH